jgi:GH24 family phage-related lysozyme (muramidase)
MATWLGGFKGDSYDREEFRAWLRTQKKPSFVSFIAVHATGAPYTLAPIGGARRMTLGLLDYYKNRQRWKGGPHFFAMGDGRVYPGTPVHLPTVHSPSWNNIAIAVEAEGDYRKGQMDWKTGKGKVVWDTMAWVYAELLEWLNIDVDDKHIRFHREDPATSHRECPGAMEKFWFIQQVKNASAPPKVLETKPAPVVIPISEKKEVVYQPGTYKFSDYVVGMMKRIEGLRLEPYNDRGTLAIGYGHNDSSGQPPKVTKGMKITATEAEQILLADMTECLRYIKAWVKVPLTQGQVDALILFIFQQGATNFRKKAVPMINEKLHWSFAKYMENYVFTSDPTKGLDRRFDLQAEIYRGNRPTKW